MSVHCQATSLGLPLTLYIRLTPDSFISLSFYIICRCVNTHTRLLTKLFRRLDNRHACLNFPFSICNRICNKIVPKSQIRRYLHMNALLLQQSSFYRVGIYHYTTDFSLWTLSNNGINELFEFFYQFHDCVFQLFCFSPQQNALLSSLCVFLFNKVNGPRRGFF